MFFWGEAIVNLDWFVWGLCSWIRWFLGGEGGRGYAFESCSMPSFYCFGHLYVWIGCPIPRTVFATFIPKDLILQDIFQRKMAFVVHPLETCLPVQFRTEMCSLQCMFKYVCLKKYVCFKEKVELLLPFQIWNKKNEFIKQVFWLSLLQRVWVLRIHFSMICRNIMWRSMSTHSSIIS